METTIISILPSLINGTTVRPNQLMKSMSDLLRMHSAFPRMKYVLGSRSISARKIWKGYTGFWKRKETKYRKIPNDSKDEAERCSKLHHYTKDARLSSRNSNQTLTATRCHPGRYGYRIINSYEKYVNRTKYDIMILNKGGA